MNAVECRQVTATALAGVHNTKGLQALEARLIEIEALALPDNGLVGFEAECGKRGQDVLARSGNAPRAVDVFHAHDPAALAGAGVQPAAECRDQRAEVQISGR